MIRHNPYPGHSGTWPEGSAGTALSAREWNAVRVRGLDDVAAGEHGGHRRGSSLAAHAEPASALAAGCGMMPLQNSTIAVLALGLSLVFCGGAVTRARAQTQVQANEPTSPNVDVVNPLAVNPIDRLSAIVERPLFAPNRRPPPPASITMPPSPPEPPSLTLLGVVIDAGGARAIVQAGPGN